MEQKIKKGRIIAFDFDGTIAKYNGFVSHHDVQEPIEETIKAMRLLKEKGFRILIYTTRGNEFVKKYCEDFSIPVDFINHNPEMQGENPGKPIAYVYVDDSVIRYTGQSAEALVSEVENFRAHWKVPIKKNMSDEKLKAICEHLNYEFWMFFELARIQSGRGFSTNEQIKNALLESFIIHFRNVVDFLYSPNNLKSDDVSANQFFDDQNNWPKIRLPLSPRIRDARSRIGKEVAHLTYTRLLIPHNKKSWPFLLLAQDVQKVWVQFLKVVPSSRLNQKLMKARDSV